MHLLGMDGTVSAIGSIPGLQQRDGVQVPAKPAVNFGEKNFTGAVG